MDRLEQAILDVDRLSPDNVDDPRTPNEVLTHWAVVYSFHRVSSDGPDSVQIADIRSTGMSYWQAAGLYDAACRVAQDEPWDDDRD